MMSRSVLLLQLLAILVCLCRTEESTTTTEPVTVREGDALEILIVLAAILAVSTISVALVLAPTAIYYNYRSNQEKDDEPSIMIH